MGRSGTPVLALFSYAGKTWMFVLVASYPSDDASATIPDFPYNDVHHSDSF